TIAFVPGAGTTSEVQTYSYTDPSPFTLHPSLYYRLQQRDYDGATDYSPIRVVQLSTQGGIRIFPNPADEVTTIAFGQPTEARGWIRLLNGNGRLLAEHTIPIGAASYELRVAQLPAGTYLLEIKVGVKEWTRRLVVE
ncbi:MAG: T9SS type A sorting domain-containing protein, partial [Saprospiraceae bacterium]